MQAQPQTTPADPRIASALAAVSAARGSDQQGPIPAEVFTRQADVLEAELNRHLEWCAKMQAVDPVAVRMHAKPAAEIAWMKAEVRRLRKCAAQAPAKAA